MGWQAPERLARLYAEADICAVTEVCDDPMGMISLEAMAAGRPVVASRLGSYQFSIQDGVTGFLVEPEDVFGFAGRLTQLLEDVELRTAMGRAGRQRAAQCDWQQIVAQHYLPLLLGGISK